MGLLGDGWDDPRSQAIMALSGGLLSQNGSQGLGAGLLGASQAMQAAKAQALKEQMIRMQMEEARAVAEDRKAKLAERQAEAQRQAGIRAGLPSMFRQPGMAGGEAVPQEIGGIPMFSKPMGAAPMRQTPGGFDIQRAVTELGMTPAEAKSYAELSQFGKPEVARTVEVMRNGKPTLIQLGKDGQEIGAGYDQWKAPVFQNFGGRTGAIDPVTLTERGSFAQTMSPSERDASARGRAGHGLAKQRLDLDQGAAVADAGGPSQVGLVRQFGKPPKDYRWKPDGTTEAIPGGPADIKAGELGAKTKSRAEHAVGQANVVIGAIDEALGKAGFFETGLTGAVMGSIPGTQAYDLRGTVDTVKANIGFDSLQKMREMSPTGGALGQVAVQELNMLQSTVSNMNPNQSEAVVKANLEKAKKHYNNWKNVMEKSGGLEPTKPAGKTITRTGTLNGKKVIQYSDGTTEYAN
jgi:hypothetical protein